MLIETLAAVAMMSASGQEYAPAQNGGPQRVAPRGDYTQSCSGAYVNQGRLYADCRDNRGSIRGTSIELNRCTDSEIRNDNGLLVCGRWRGEYEGRPGNGGGNGPGNGNPGWPGPGNGGGNGGGWGGGRGGAITVFRDAGYRGASFRFDDAIPNLANTGFNDAISSVRLRGTWELCTDSYFRGTCRTVSDDVFNMQQLGMNDRISSMRPVRR